MRRLVITYIALLGLALVSWLVVPPAVAIPIAFAKAALIGAIFMDLARAHAVPRIAALVALAFLALLCVGVYADVISR
jgi:caa(3)-type oxidase subunit IV